MQVEASDERKNSVVDAVQQLLQALCDQGVIEERQSRECFRGLARSPEHLRHVLGFCCKPSKPDEDISEGVFIIEAVEDNCFYISDFLTTGEIGIPMRVELPLFVCEILKGHEGWGEPKISLDRSP